MDKLLSLRKEAFAKEFSARALKRARAYSMEGYVFDVSVSAEDSGDAAVSIVSVEAKCFASYRKKRKHGVCIRMKAPSYQLVKCTCQCEAGEGERCSNVCGVLFYLTAHAAFLREEADVRAQTSPTSGKRQWGVPKRHITPDLPVPELNFKKPKEREPFLVEAPYSADYDPRPVKLQEVSASSVQTIRTGLVSAGKSPENCLALRYMTPERVVECSQGIFFREAELSKTLYEDLREKPLQFPEYLSPFFSALRQNQLPPSKVDVLSWAADLCVALGNANAADVELATRQQARSDSWFLERICRLTASNFGRIIRRQRNFRTLACEILYHKPPSALPSLVFGRRMEKEAVALYSTLHPEYEVTECGLVVHPTMQFLAASPDRMLTNLQTGDRGILEVKCPSSIQTTPTVAAVEKASFCLHKVDGKVCLKRNHAYFWQVQGLMACAGLLWCDFAVLCGGELFVERVLFDAEKWAEGVASLKSFFFNHFAPELVYPGFDEER